MAAGQASVESASRLGSWSFGILGEQWRTWPVEPPGHRYQAHCLGIVLGLEVSVKRSRLALMQGMVKVPGVGAYMCEAGVHTVVPRSPMGLGWVHPLVCSQLLTEEQVV